MKDNIQPKYIIIIIKKEKKGRCAHFTLANS